tara:strand:+ start:324 stop:527 length:204 start_codon:yes stop_codon:yes gene_type:complete
MIKTLGLDKIEPTTLIPRKRIIEQGIPSSTFDRWVNDEVNPLPTIKVNRKVFVTMKDWNNYVEKHRR